MKPRFHVSGAAELHSKHEVTDGIHNAVQYLRSGHNSILGLTGGASTDGQKNRRKPKEAEPSREHRRHLLPVEYGGQKSLSQGAATQVVSAPSLRM